MAGHLGLTTSAFTRTYCEKTNGAWHLREETGKPDCQFLRGKRCGIYEARPEQCRTWPFWPEVMNAKRWNDDVKSFCPGVGKGRLWTAKEILAVLDSQKTWSERLG